MKTLAVKLHPQTQNIKSTEALLMAELGDGIHWPSVDEDLGINGLLVDTH